MGSWRNSKVSTVGGRTRVIPRESTIHAAVARNLDLWSRGQPWCWQHFPNGLGLSGPSMAKAIGGGEREAKILGGMIARAIAVLREMGAYEEGWPDFGVFWSGPACFIELKRPERRSGPKARDEQAKIHERLRAIGCPVEVADSVDGVERALLGWGVPLSNRSLLNFGETDGRSERA